MQIFKIILFLISPFTIFSQEINYRKYINISEGTLGIIEFTLIIKEEGEFVFTFFEEEDCYETNEKVIGNWHQKKDTLFFLSKKNNSNFNFNETRAIILDANNVKIIKSKIPWINGMRMWLIKK